MNLVTGEWLPVLYQSGEVKKVSLENFFRDADHIIDLAVPPHQRVALMRLLICIAQTALNGPENEDQWSACKKDIPDACLEYLTEHTEKFNLYGDNPFMQVPTLKASHNATVDKLDFGLSSGNNACLFDHAASPAGRLHDDRWIALMLVTFLNNSPGGKIGVTKWGDKSTQPGKEKGPGESEHAPCIEGSLLHSYVRRNNMLATVHVNMLTRAAIDELANIRWGRPVWELDRTDRDNAELRKSVTTYLGRLVPLSRAVLLEKGSRTFTLANGLNYPKLPECRETAGTVVERDERLAYISTSLDRHPWRELNSILSLKSNKKGGPLAFRHLQRRSTSESLDIWTGGLAVDRGKILDTGEWSFNVPADMLGNEGALGKYQGGVEHAEKAESNLLASVKEYARTMKMEKAPVSKARVHFWSWLDQHYDCLLESANDAFTSLDDKWTPLLRRAMRSAYQAACPAATPRQIQAFAIGQSRLKLPNMEKNHAQRDRKTA